MGALGSAIQSFYGMYRDAHRPLRALVDLDYARCELQVRYGGQQHWIRGHKGNLVDAMFLPSPDQSSQSASGGPSSWESSSRTNHGRPMPNGVQRLDQSSDRVVLLCNPNAGLYEFMAHQVSG